MKIKKTGYMISCILFFISAIISIFLGFGTKNTYWALINAVIIITPSFIQTIKNIRNNKKSDSIAIIYIVLCLIILFYLGGIFATFLLIFKAIEIPLY